MDVLFLVDGNMKNPGQSNGYKTSAMIGKKIGVFGDGLIWFL